MRVSPAAAALLLYAGSTATAQSTFPHETLARTGQAVSGAAPGTIIAAWNRYLFPTVNNSGHVAFSGWLNSAVSPGALIAITPAGPTLIARSGMAAPGFPSGQTLGNFHIPMTDDAGRVALMAEIPGPGTRRALYLAQAPSSLVLVAGSSPAPPPEPDIPFALFSPWAWAMNPSGSVAIGDISSYRWTNGVFESIARRLDQVPGLPEGNLYDRSGILAINAAGVSAFSASVTGPDSTGGLFVGAPGSVSPLALADTQAPGFAPGIHYQGFNHHTINNAGTVAFWGSTRPAGEFGPTTEAIWIGTPGNVIAAVKEHDPAPGTAPGVLFGYISHTPALRNPALNGRGEIAFRAQLEGPGIHANNDSGIWSGSPGNLSLAAREGDPVPGVADGTLRFFIDHPNVNDSGDIAFLAQISVAGLDSGNHGLFVCTPGEPLQLVARTGQLFEIAPDEFKTISWLAISSGSGGEDGRPSSLNDNRQLVFSATFTDETCAIIRVTIPAPGTASGVALLLVLGARRRPRVHSDRATGQ